MIPRVCRAAAVAIGLAAATLATAQSPAPVGQRPADVLGSTLTFGFLSERLEDSVRYMEPALQLVARQLAPMGVRKVRMQVAPSMEQMAEWLRVGRVDLFASTPYPALRVAQLAGVEPSLHGVAVKAARSVILVRKDGPVRTFDDLTNRRLAFTFVYSSPGYFIPHLMLRNHGFVNDRETPGRKVVFTSLSGKGTNSMYWLYFGRCDAAAVAEDETQKVPRKLAESLRVLVRSEAYPGFLMLMSPALSGSARETLSSYFRDLHKNPDGKRMLEQAYGCSNMEPIGPWVQTWIQDARSAMKELAPR